MPGVVTKPVQEDMAAPKLSKEEKAAKKLRKAQKAEKKAEKEKKRKESASEDDSDAEDKPKAKKAKKVKEAAPVKKAASDSASEDSMEAEVEDDAGDRLSDDAFRAKHEITLKGGTAAPFQTFDEAPFGKHLLQAFKTAGFKAPSSIQAQAWPIALSGKDLLAVAKTGSGKTCGYLLPTFHKIMESGPRKVSGKGAKGNHPMALVMAPTRELANQIHDEAVKFGRAAGLRSVAVYGGAPKGPQIRDLQAGVDIVIATPGRMLDMLQFKCFDGSTPTSLAEVSTIILDEADRMLDMGFEKDILKIVESCPPQGRQTLFFTATWPKAVARVAGQILRNPVQVNIGNTDELSANKDVEQVIVRCKHAEKFDKLVEMVKGLEDGARTIIFANKKRDVQGLADGLWSGGCFVDSIHGDKEQREREQILGQFKRGEVKILVATDVAARGLDIKGVDQVINHDFPICIEDYVHRIGRTGRAGIKGKATTFFMDSDAHHSRELVKIMTEAQQEVPADLKQLAMSSRPSAGKKPWRGGGGRGGGRGRGGGGRGGGRGGGGRRW